MEAARLINHFPYLVIHRIYNYSNLYKNKRWQGFTVIMAAAYTKDLLYQISPSKVKAKKPINKVLNSS
jgi:hypothetical protein